MLRRLRLVIGLTVGALVLHPAGAVAMERALMDRLLTLATSQPNSPEFRETLVKQLTAEAEKTRNVSTAVVQQSKL